MVWGCGHPPRWSCSGDAVAGKTTVFRCKKAMIFARKSRVFDRFLHEIARFSCIFGVYSAYPDVSDRAVPGAFSSVVAHLLSLALLSPGVRSVCGRCAVGVRSVRRPVSECMTDKSEYPTRSRAGRPGCYPQRPGSRSTAQRKPGRPGAVRLNDQSRPTTQREARAASPILSGVGSLGFWEIGEIWGGSTRLRDNGGRRSPRAGRPGCWPQRSRSRSTPQRTTCRPGAVRLNRSRAGAACCLVSPVCV